MFAKSIGGFADQNLAAMQKVVLALLEKERLFQAGIALKRHKAALSARYLRKVSICELW